MEKTKRRIFVAIPISQSLQNEIADWTNGYSELPVRWLAGKNLHITLVPPWYEDDLEMVRAKCEKVLGINSFEIKFAQVTYGPEPKRPRLIWAKGGASQEIEILKSKIESALGNEPESRPFKPHLTLARFRPEAFSSFSIEKLDEKVSWKETVNSFVLMESHLSSSGADYEVLASYSLAATKGWDSE